MLYDDMVLKETELSSKYVYTDTRYLLWCVCASINIQYIKIGNKIEYRNIISTRDEIVQYVVNKHNRMDCAKYSKSAIVHEKLKCHRQGHQCSPGIYTTYKEGCEQYSTLRWQCLILDPLS